MLGLTLMTRAPSNRSTLAKLQLEAGCCPARGGYGRSIAVLIGGAPVVKVSEDVLAQPLLGVCYDILDMVELVPSGLSVASSQM